MNCRCCGRKRRFAMEGERNDAAGLGLSTERQTLAGSSMIASGTDRVTLNRRDSDRAVVFIIPWRPRMRKSADLMTLGVVLAKRSRALKQRKKDGSRPKLIALQGKSRCNRPSLMQRRQKPISSAHLSRPRATSKILGTPRRNEHCAPLARPGQAAASARTACSGLRLVH